MHASIGETKVVYDSVNYMQVRESASHTDTVMSPTTSDIHPTLDDSSQQRCCCRCYLRRHNICCTCCLGCCSVGCVWVTVFCLYFLVIIPAGVLLIIHGHTKAIPLTLSLGLVILFVFTCVLPGAYLALRYRRSTRKIAVNALRARVARAAASDQQRDSLTKHIVDDCGISPADEAHQPPGLRDA